MKNIFRVFIALFCTTMVVNAQISRKEKQALLDLYANTIGEKWNNTWNLDDEPKNWYGVEIENNHVVELNLFRNNLTGKIPNSIKELRELRVINLSFNVLEGAISSALFEMPNLVVMRLEMNKLSGRLPMDYSKALKLEQLSLFNNLLEGYIPEGIGELTNLKLLNLSSNYLIGVLPKSLEQLSNLQQLELFGNKLNGSIEVELGKLKNLRELVLSYNEFEGDLHRSVADLSNLEFVQLQGNNFQSLNSLLLLKSDGLATFDSDDEFLNLKFSNNNIDRTRFADTKFEDTGN